MPQVMLAKTIRVNGHSVRAWSPGIMVDENDRLTVIDPDNNNELIKGMTYRFAAKLISSGLMRIAEGEE